MGKLALQKRMFRPICQHAKHYDCMLQREKEHGKILKSTSYSEINKLDKLVRPDGLEQCIVYTRGC